MRRLPKSQEKIVKGTVSGEPGLLEEGEEQGGG